MQRELWFKKCLEKLGQYLLRVLVPNRLLACPDMIGCGSAGGNREKYYLMLQEFCHKYDAKIFMFKH